MGQLSLAEMQSYSGDPDNRLPFPLPPRGCLRRSREYLRDLGRSNVSHPRSNHVCEQFSLGGYGIVFRFRCWSGVAHPDVALALRKDFGPVRTVLLRHLGRPVGSVSREVL